MTEYFVREMAKPVPDRSSRRAIPRSKEEVGFAPAPEHVCRSLAGRWRKEHEPDRDGVCFWCDKVVN